MTAGGSWFERHTAGAPPFLRRRAAGYLAAVPDGPEPERLVAAAGAALDVVLAHPGDRAAALDLLAADALVTLALLAQAERDPAALGAFAEGLLGPRRPGA